MRKAGRSLDVVCVCPSSSGIASATVVKGNGSGSQGLELRALDVGKTVD